MKNNYHKITLPEGVYHVTVEMGPEITGAEAQEAAAAVAKQGGVTVSSARLVPGRRVLVSQRMPLAGAKAQMLTRIEEEMIIKTTEAKWPTSPADARQALADALIADLSLHINPGSPLARRVEAYQAPKPEPLPPTAVSTATLAAQALMQHSWHVALDYGLEQYVVSCDRPITYQEARTAACKAKQDRASVVYVGRSEAVFGGMAITRLAIMVTPKGQDVPPAPDAQADEPEQAEASSACDAEECWCVDCAKTRVDAEAAKVGDLTRQLFEVRAERAGLMRAVRVRDKALASIKADIAGLRVQEFEPSPFKESTRG